MQCIFLFLRYLFSSKHTPGPGPGPKGRYYS